MRAFLSAPASIALALSAAAGAQPGADQPPARPNPAPGSYVVVLDRTADGAPYAPAARALAEFRAAALTIDLGDGGLGPVFAELARLHPPPAYVAFVVPPGRVEDNFVGEVFQRATRLNNDPELDFSYGFITGATPDDALALVRAVERAERDRDVPQRFAAIGHTFRENDLGMFAIQQAAWMRDYGFQAADINPIDGSKEWADRAPAEVAKLDGASLVFVAGHGMGDNLCGIDAALFQGFRLDRAVVVNGACHSISTTIRHDISPETMGVVTTPIPADRSICLRLIHAGAIAQLGSTASSGWMNVSPAIEGFFNEGESVGDALRQRLNGYIQEAGLREIHVIPFKDGEPSPQFLGPDRDPGHVQSFARVALIGDPAYRPYPDGRARVAFPIVPNRPHPMGENVNAPPAPDLSAWTIPQLVAELEEPKVPSFAGLNEIIRRGKDAVPPLLEAMKTTKSWQIPKALGALKDSSAIDPLIESLATNRTSPFKDVVAEALELITGNKLGDNAAAWKAWRQKEAK